MDLNRLDDTFTCGQCKSIFNSLNIFLQHKNSCYLVINEVEKITEKSDVHNVYYQARNTNISESKCEITCEICKKEFKKYKSLELHKKIHREKTYQCPLCGRCFGQSSHLQNHMQSHKVWPDGLNDTTCKETTAELLSYACPYCDANLSNYNQFRGHLKGHLPLKKYKCVQDNCAELFDNIHLLLEHVSCNHIPQIFNCYLCSKEFRSLADIALHQHNHEKTMAVDRKKYKCDHCDAIYVKKSTLVLHLATANHNNVCIHCDKSFTSDKRLRLHLQTHKEIKPYACETCGQSFRLRKYLNTHRLKHGESRYLCKICNSRFKRADILSRHMKIHQCAKKLQCPFKDKVGCEMEFTRKDKLNQHIIFHRNKMSVISKKQNKIKEQSLQILIVNVNEKC